MKKKGLALLLAACMTLSGMGSITSYASEVPVEKEETSEAAQQNPEVGIVEETPEISEESTQIDETVPETTESEATEEENVDTEDPEAEAIEPEEKEEVVPAETTGDFHGEIEVDETAISVVDKDGNVTYVDMSEDDTIVEEVATFRAATPQIVNFRYRSGVIEYEEPATGTEGYTAGSYGADAAYLGRSGNKVRFMLAGVIGEVPASNVQVISKSSAKSVSYYTVSGGRLNHYISTNVNSSNYGSVLDNGPAPSYLKSGTKYYSYDGHYFYTEANFGNMLDDYNMETREHSVNPNNPYYNYFQFLPLRSQSNYNGSALNTMLNNRVTISSKMRNTGNDFVNHQNKYGTNALLMTGIGANESAWGTSSIAREKNNIFGLNAVDSSPGESADYFATVSQCIKEFAETWLSKQYLDPQDWKYFGAFLGNKASGMNVKYASDPYWGEKAAGMAWLLDRSNGNKDANKYTIGIKDTVKPNNVINVRKESTTSSTVLYKTKKNANCAFIILNDTPVNGFYKIQSEGVLKSDRSGINSSSGVYDFKNMYAYLSSDYLKIANKGTGGGNNSGSDNETPPPIQYEKITEGTYVLESVAKAGKVVSVADSSLANNAKVNVIDNKKISSQRIEVRSAGGNYYYLIAEHSGKALDVRDGSSADGTIVQQYALDTSAAAQKWAFIDAGNGSYYIQSAVGTMMEVNGSAVQAGKSDKSSAQKWKLQKSTYQPVKNGTYTIANKVNGNQVLTVEAGSMNDGGNIQINASNNMSAQRFEVRYKKDGYYQILAENSGKSLDVASGRTENGTNLQQYGWNDDLVKAQLWKFVDAGNGYYYIRSKTGNVIDLSNKSATKGSNVYMWEMTGGNSQQWKLVSSSYRPVKDGEYVIGNVKNTSAVMNVSGSNVQIGSYDNSENQKFKVTYVSDGYYHITLRSNGKSLDVKSGSTANKANLQVFSKNGADAQLWKFVDAGNGAYYIRSKLGTAIDLVSGNTTAGTNIQMYAMCNTSAQKWILNKDLVEVTDRPIENGTYVIKNASNPKTALDVEGGAEKNGGNIRLYNFNDSSAQRYEFYYVGDGYYKIMTERTGRSLDVRGGSSKAGTNLQQYEWNYVTAQLWKLLPAGDGSYYIQSKLGTVLDLNKDTALSGANVQMNTRGNRATQKWKIEKSEYRPFANGVYSFRVAASKNQVLDIEDGSMKDGGNLWLFLGNGSAAQNFEVTHVKDGYYKIISRKSGKALQYDPKNSGNKANVYQQTWNGKDEQLWKFVQGYGGYFIKSKTGKVFDVTSGKLVERTNIQTHTMNNVNAQKWTLRREDEYKAAKIPNGVYTIQTALKKDLLLDVAHGSTANGANIQVEMKNGGNAQKFKITEVSGGYYKIISVKSGKALDVTSGSMLPSTNVQQCVWNGTNAQLWKFVDAGDGTYYIQSKLGTVLDVYDASDKPKTNVHAYNSNKSKAQKWILK